MDRHGPALEGHAQHLPLALGQRIGPVEHGLGGERRVDDTEPGVHPAHHRPAA